MLPAVEVLALAAFVAVSYAVGYNRGRHDAELATAADSKPERVDPTYRSAANRGAAIRTAAILAADRAAAAADERARRGPLPVSRTAPVERDGT